MSRKPKHHDPGLKRLINDVIDKVEKDEKLFDVHIDRLREGVSEKIGHPVTCDSCTQPGCCSQLTFLTLYETLPIARHLRLQGKATPAFIAELRALGEEQEGLGKTKWFDKGQPCLFLTKQKRCSIYDIRPMACRQYMVWSEVKYCQPPSSNDINIKYADTQEIQRMTIEQSGALLHVLGLSGDGLLFLGSLPRMLAIVLEALEKPQLVDFLAHILNQHYPSINNYRRWLLGENPFTKKLRESEKLTDSEG